MHNVLHRLLNARPVADWLHNTSFRRQLSYAVTAGVVCIALFSALVSSWQGSRQIRRTLVEQGERISESLARQSALALLYASSDNAADAVNATLAFPDVTRVEIRNAGDQVLIVRGAMGTDFLSTPFPGAAIRSAYLEAETDDVWRFVAPVLTQGADSPLEAAERKQEFIGYVRVVQSKTTLSRMMLRVFFINLAISFFFAFVFLFAIRLLADRLTRPLTELSEAMARAERGEANAHAALSGPKDLVDMAQGFNRMITVLQDREEALRESEARYRTLVEHAPDAIVVLDVDAGCFLDANDNAARLFGLSNAQLLKVGLVELSAPRQPDGRHSGEAAAEQIEKALVGDTPAFEWTYRNAAGEDFPCEVRLVRLPAAGRRLVRGSITDITERKQAEERIRFLAHHDALTGLPNRLLLQDRISQAIAQAQRTDGLVAVLFIDLDHFKRINDSLGHHVGDRLLQAAAQRLLHCLRASDSVARLGGDEFVISLPVVADSNYVALVAQKIIEALREPFSMDRTELYAGGSIGISLYPVDGQDVDTLMRAADTAMYHAKDKGRGNYQFFTPALNEAAQQRLVMENRLHQALARGEFTLHYQPQVDLENGRIFSSEALLRWRQPEGGFIPCAEFISVAEESGLIVPIGAWALREACTQLKRWRDAGHAELRIAVNLSSRQFDQPGFQSLVADVLADTGLPATALELEITESILMRPSEDNLAALHQLSALGVQLSVDDFGTGYSSLAYLQRFPINALKIDRSFVDGIGDDPHDAAIVTAIIAMAQSLRLQVIAEGVETAEQASFLQARGCLAAQGYYFSKPVPAEVFFELLEKQVQWPRTTLDTPR